MLVCSSVAFGAYFSSQIYTLKPSKYSFIFFKFINMKCLNMNIFYFFVLSFDSTGKHYRKNFLYTAKNAISI